MTARGPVAIALGVLAVTAGCTPTEDVRVRLCKDLAGQLSGAPAPLTWQAVDRTLERYGDQVVSVRFTDAEGATHQAACHYAWDHNAEEYSLSSDPAADYDTNPHRVVVDGREVSGRPLAEAVNAAMVEQARGFLDRLGELLRRLFGGGGGGGTTTSA